MMRKLAALLDQEGHARAVLVPEPGRLSINAASRRDDLSSDPPAAELGTDLAPNLVERVKTMTPRAFASQARGDALNAAAG